MRSRIGRSGMPGLVALLLSVLLLNGCRPSAIWSPDGQQVALDVRGALLTFSLASKQFTKRSTGRNLALCPSWSPDGKRLCYYSATMRTDVVSALALLSTDLETGQTTTLLPYVPSHRAPLLSISLEPTAALARETLGIAYSPDGKQVVFTAYPGNEPPLWIMGTDGTGLRSLTAQGMMGAYPAWSPDSAQIAYATANGIKVVKPDGTGGHLVLDAKKHPWAVHIAGPPVWTPDGKALLALIDVRNEDANEIVAQRGELWRVPVETDAPVRLAKLGGPPHMASLAPAAGGLCLFTTPSGELAPGEAPEKLSIQLLTGAFDKAQTVAEFEGAKPRRRPFELPKKGSQPDVYPVLSLSPDLKSIAFPVSMIGEPAQLVIQPTSGAPAESFTLPLPVPPIPKF